MGWEVGTVGFRIQASEERASFGFCQEYGMREGFAFIQALRLDPKTLYENRERERGRRGIGIEALLL